jgi:type IV secretion system protein VirD4
MSDFGQLIVGNDDDANLRVSLGFGGTQVFRSQSFGPVIVFGPQRSGKTTGIVIPAVLEWDGPCLVTSVRFDVAQKTLTRREKMGKVYIFDPTGLAEHSDKLRDHCVGWSPLDGVDTWDRAVQRANGLSEGVSTGARDGNFWTVSARQLLAPLLFAAAKCGDSMGNVLEWLGTDRGRLGDILSDHVTQRAGIDLPSHNPYFTHDRDAFDGRSVDADWLRFVGAIGRITQYAENTYTGICATATAMLEVFTYTAVQQRCDAGGLRLAEFLDGGANTLYVCAPASQQRLYMPLFTALVREVLTRVYEHNAIHVDTSQSLDFLLCLDEAGNIARLEDLDSIATTAAGSGIQLVSVFHDMSQLSYSYDEPRARLIANNHSGMVFLPGNRDPETNHFLVAVLQDEEVRGLTHRGWNFTDLRKMDESNQLCIYKALNPVVLRSRRSYLDPRLIELSSQAGAGLPTQRGATSEAVKRQGT